MKSDEKLMERAARLLSGVRKVAVFTGAGVSRESGIPTFREAGTGLWAQYDPMRLATVEGFLADPKLVWDWYAYRRNKVAEVEPNPGHYAVAALEELVDSVTVITQNIDSLHRRAGSTDVVELHGNISRVKCFSGDTVYPEWSDDEYDGELPPRCGQCGGYLRPDVVWFGETLPQEAISRSFELAKSCDVMLVIGTSGQVQPAASLPPTAREAGARVIEVNPEPSAITPHADLLLEGKSGEVLPPVVERLREMMAGK